MGYRPDQSPGCGEYILLCLTVAVFFGIAYFEDTKPHNEYVQNKTKSILSQAHKEAVNSVDTLDLQGLFVNTESANKDSLRLAKEMHNWMKYQGENPRFCDYKQIYNKVDMENGKKGFQLSKNMWHINTSKAMKDPDFAKIYNQYCQTIKQLEIARRQNKYK